ncbi:hypothetical protein BDN71DRAFT_1506276 [Pleurotus eryngii]|uniref:Uncharacterized protein n=1 Tax=Pleurotus eryngii TaxID=5323 RepID=A0A9P5ZYR1_PLEER|nr:hypothetical protein BDN71DRAFT_1506276 [Pleurotus eryngii]
MTADNIGHHTPMGSAVSKTELTRTNNDKGPASDKADTDGKLTVAQDIAGIVLSTLQQAAELAPVPYLREAAGLAVALFDMVQGTLENKSAFKGLASDACELVYTATSVWKDREEDNDGKPLPQDLIDHLKELLKTMTDVMQFAKARASRGPFARFISHKADAGRIQGFRAQIKDAMDRFGMQSHITVRDAVSRIQEQQAAILAALEAHAPNKSQLIASTEASSNPSSAPSTPHTPPFPRPAHAFTSFGNIVNNGEGTFNSVNGNYVVNNSSTNTSSKNSGNVMNISTVNSNNRYDAGGMGRANGNSRSMGMGSGPGRPLAAGRRKAEQQPGQRGRRRGMAATP